MNEFVEYVLEIFEGAGEIRAKRMFGGYGVYRGDLMFGLIADDVLYLKTDEQSVGMFRERGQSPFVYVKKGEPAKSSYWSAPEEMFDDPEEAERWLAIACDAAVRFRNRPSRRRKKRA